jgi:hypothetical protein
VDREWRQEDAHQREEEDSIGGDEEHTTGKR